MIHFNVGHLITSQQQSDELQRHLDGNWYALKLGTTNSPTQNRIASVIYKDEEDVLARGGWLLMKYPDAQRIHKE